MGWVHKNIDRLVFAPLLLALASAGCEWSNKSHELPKAFLELREKRRHMPDEVRFVLDNPERFTLFSIEGEDQPPDVTTETLFHGFNVLGKSEIEDADERKALLEALYRSIADSEHAAICFWPRHGIRASRGDQ